MNDDLPRSFYDRVGGRLWEGDSATAKEVRLSIRIIYHRFGPLGDFLTEVSDELVFGLDWLVNGSRVGDMAIVLVQGLLENVQVPVLESLAPFLYELDLWRNGHCDEATGG